MWAKVGDIGIADVGSRISDLGFRFSGGGEAGGGNGFGFSEFGFLLRQGYGGRGFFDIATKWRVMSETSGGPSRPGAFVYVRLSADNCA